MRSIARWCVTPSPAGARRLAGGASIGLAALSMSAGSAYNRQLQPERNAELRGSAVARARRPQGGGRPGADRDRRQPRTRDGSRGQGARRGDARPRRQATGGRVGRIARTARTRARRSRTPGRWRSRIVTMSELASKFTVAQAQRSSSTPHRRARVIGCRSPVGGAGRRAERIKATSRQRGSRSDRGADRAALVFGSLLAASLPLITARVALGAGTATIGLLSHVIDMASFSSQLSLLIGLGVGVDYALFIVTRYRQGLAARQERRGRDRRRDRHLGPRSPVRRDDRLHRAVGDVRSRGQLPVWRRDRGVGRGRVHGRNRADAVTGDCWGSSGTRVLGRRARRALAGRRAEGQRRAGPVGPLDRRAAGPPSPVRDGRSAGDGRDRDPVLLDAPRLLRRGLGPGRQHHTPGI